MKNIIIILLITIFTLIYAIPALADEKPVNQNSPPNQIENKNVNENAPFRLVTPDEFAQKTNKLTETGSAAAGDIILSLSKFAILVELIILIFSQVFKITVVRNYALSAIGFSLIAVFIFWGLPLIFGLIKYAVNTFNT